MDVLVTIGQFSKMTYLSVKALRHYHDVGLLEPAAVDPSSGYRLYSAAQTSTAQAIRRFRDLGMPLDRIRAVLDAPDVDARNHAILVHLRHMQEQLAQTQATVASLQALLEDVRRPADVELRSVPATPTLAISEPVGFEDCPAWLGTALAELHQALDGLGIGPTGPDGALYPDEFFESGKGTVVAFVPIGGSGTPVAVGAAGRLGRAAPHQLGASDLAVMVHTGPFADIDQTYGALGTVVAERGIGAPGPIREHYPADDRAEVCWPVDLSSPGAS
ncbi:MAG TPA: MerR family transcriptional regulator [Acidimicrobiales bacterium]|nr:MerR family transcriptional regulator [Acidimicrobiales bacterium]